VKHLLKKATDPYKALMAYPGTPLESGISPAKLLMGKRIRTTLATLPSQLDSKWHYIEQFREKDSTLRPDRRRILTCPIRRSACQTSSREILFGFLHQ